MPEYIWTAIDQHGNAVIPRLNAAPPAPAKAELESRGDKQLRLHTDEVATVLATQNEPGPRVSAEDELKWRLAGPISFWEAWSRCHGQSKLTTGLVLAAAVFGWFRGHLVGTANCLGFLFENLRHETRSLIARDAPRRKLSPGLSPAPPNRRRWFPSRC